MGKHDKSDEKPEEEKGEEKPEEGGDKPDPGKDAGASSKEQGKPEEVPTKETVILPPLLEFRFSAQDKQFCFQEVPDLPAGAPRYSSPDRGHQIPALPDPAHLPKTLQGYGFIQDAARQAQFFEQYEPSWF